MSQKRRYEKREGPPTGLFTRLDAMTLEELNRAVEAQPGATPASIATEVVDEWVRSPRLRAELVVPVPKVRGPREGGKVFTRPSKEAAEVLHQEFQRPNRAFYAILVQWADARRLKACSTAPAPRAHAARTATPARGARSAGRAGRASP